MLRPRPFVAFASFACAIASCVVTPPPSAGPNAPGPVTGGPGATPVAQPTAQRLPERISLRVTAPLTIGDHVLGRPLDRNFEYFTGPQSVSVFGSPDAPSAPIVTQPNAVQFESLVVEDAWSIRAHASAWGVGSADLGAQSTNRYASYRALEVTEVHEVDETQALREAPQNAVWYLSKIYYGYSYEVVLTGNSTAFDASVAGQFKVAKGGIDAFASKNKLTMKVVGKGLVPNGDALFIRNPSELQTAYKRSETPSPIYVEYRLIPGRTPPNAEPIAWKEAPTPLGGDYRLTSVSVWISERKDKPAWDALENKPDPIVVVSVSGQGEVFRCERQNVLVESEVHCPSGKVLRLSDSSSFTVSVVDRDTRHHDPIGTGSARISERKPSRPLELKTTGSLNRAVLQLEGPL